ncbi:membrane protein involved in aromatic hydrocarbon degradation [Thiorhodococcus drewsii AZ1]|uniref:Membrane protein involved in aromatic hydrocarbon degradation n=1 Tax=Thiorhodococcus drewsii AZ1 TaxID=765913 RepID=G2E0A8_9GAMM|nr:outer membrane protein transport protein [Thiorhodococcus drewsii]EGV31836.1 membrane protein involved in aromatic hydrocarbon degradation [Thiorhodococcus drewsii AZ1]
MKSRVKGALAVAVTVVVGLPTTVSATNGYFSHGWGVKSKAMAGVATALPLDTLVSATNPAGMAFIGDSFDVGVAFFSPSPRGYEANSDYATQQVQTPGGSITMPAGSFVTPGDYESSGDWFLIPSFGYNHRLDERSSIGVSVFGNGGMNTKYKQRAPFENFAAYPNQRIGAYPDGSMGPLYDFSSGRPVPVTDPIEGTVNGNPNGVYSATTPTGINLEQLFIEVPYSYRLSDGKQSIGIAPVFAIQRFEATGLEPFKQLSVRPDKVTNNGVDWSYGVGLHLGWYGEINDRLALGASYRTTVWMSKFDDYAGLFADGGSFDIPAMFNFGLAFKARPNLTLAFDYQHIFYDESHSIANSNDVDVSGCQGGAPKPSYCLGANSGVGFGWESMDVFKLGVKYDPNDRLSLMAGVSYNTDFLRSDRQGLFNILAPATVRWHLTAGAAYRVNDRDEFSFSVAYMPKETFDGSSPALTQTQTGSLYMEQLELGVGWSHRF